MAYSAYKLFVQHIKQDPHHWARQNSLAKLGRTQYGTLVTNNSTFLRRQNVFLCIRFLEPMKQITNHFQTRPCAAVLACAPSNSAADLLAERLLDIVSPSDLAR